MNPRRVFAVDDPDVNPYRLLTALVVPRPIAWVSTLSGDGVVNLAPHSFFTVSSNRPPVVQFTSVGVKDTLRNVLATGEFVVNLAGLPQMDAVNQTSAPYEAGVDEAAALGIAMEPSELVAPPRVSDAPASIECVLHTTIEVGTCTLVLGRVVAVTVRDEAMVDGSPSMSRLQPVSRLGGAEWGLPPEVVALERPLQPPP
ncbi:MULTISPECIES: flavin reductase family protein [unclassified Nocardioides]|uniref:flavin reductase family protein n=1 Tax=unclassified Nocardioides TaxID=2615069 RepID=UPI001F396707|nr:MULTISPECIES: flavin reductase family protein [unclassified Nocardioides]